MKLDNNLIFGLVSAISASICFILLIKDKKKFINDVLGFKLRIFFAIVMLIILSIVFFYKYFNT